MGYQNIEKSYYEKSYILMGLHSKQRKFKNIENIGIFNPKLNVVYIKNIKDIDVNILRHISQEVIGYKKTKTEKILRKKMLA